MITIILIAFILTGLWCILYYTAPESPMDRTNYDGFYIKPVNLYRKKPPKATFFGRLDGKTVFMEGPYEEEFLNCIEANRWKKEKKEERCK